MIDRMVKKKTKDRCEDVPKTVFCLSKAYCFAVIGYRLINISSNSKCKF